MDLLQAFNIALTIAAALGGWLVKGLFEKIKDLEKANKDLSDIIHELRAILPMRYVLREDFKDDMDNLFGILRRIEEKLDRKVDR